MIDIHLLNRIGSKLYSKLSKFHINIKILYKTTFSTTYNISFSSYPKAIAMVSSGKIKPEVLISHQFILKESEKAFQCAYSPDSGAIKVMIRCNA